MATFTPGQQVVTLKNTPVLTITGDTLAPDLPIGTVVTIVTGPFQIVGKSGEFWSITGNGRTGYVKGDRIEAYNNDPNPPGQGTNRRIWVGVPEGGDGHEVQKQNWGGGYVKADPAHDFWMNYNPGVFAVATEYAWNEALRDWVFKIENRGQAGEFLFQDPFGWVQFEHGTHRDDRLNRLEVYQKDNGPDLPRFEFPPSVETPPPPPPTEEPPMPIPDPLPWPDPADNLVVNSDFGQGWTTHPRTGNQTPNGWLLTITPNGQPNLWPIKNQQGRTVPSLAWVVPECVHKLPTQLPPNEQKGQPRALLVGPAANVYKLFGKDRWSATLSQTIHGTPGRFVRVVAYILAETPDKPTAPDGKLESDHFHVLVELESDVPSADTRMYASMKERRDIPSNDRAWNRFEVDGRVSVDGDFTVALSFQQNWPGVCDFFVGPVMAVYVDDVPPVDPPDDEEPPAVDTAAVLTAVAQIEAQAQQIRNLLGRG